MNSVPGRKALTPSGGCVYSDLPTCMMAYRHTHARKHTHAHTHLIKIKCILFNKKQIICTYNLRNYIPSFWVPLLSECHFNVCTLFPCTFSLVPFWLLWLKPITKTAYRRIYLSLWSRGIRIHDYHISVAVGRYSDWSSKLHTHISNRKQELCKGMASSFETSRPAPLTNFLQQGNC